MKHLQLTTIAAVVLVWCRPSWLQEIQEDVYSCEKANSKRKRHPATRNA